MNFPSLEEQCVQIVEFCGISFQKPGCNGTTSRTKNRGDHDSASTHTASLQEAARRDREKEKTKLPYTLNWLPSNQNKNIGFRQNPSIILSLTFSNVNVFVKKNYNIKDVKHPEFVA